MKHWMILGALAVCSLAAPARAEPEKAAAPAPAEAPKKKAGGKEPDMAAMMAAYEKAGAVGEPHKLLQKMVGKWTATVKHWNGPGEPMTEPGTSETKSILGDRFVQSTFTSSFMGKPFSGLSTMGYDNTKKQYVGTWVDTMSTGIARSEGKADAAGQVITSTMVSSNPLTGKDSRMRLVTTMKDDATYVDEFFEKRGGKETKVMEITYTKVK